MEQEQHVCPVWVGKLMVSPLRKLYQNPSKLLNKYIDPGMQILEVGPALGFFSLPIARKIGDSGKLYCVDIQQKMLAKLEQRALMAELLHRIETRISNQDSFKVNNLKGQIDFALLFAVVHEVPHQAVLFKEVASTLKTNGKVFFAEPRGHVSKEQFEQSLKTAESQNLISHESIQVRGSHAIVLKKV